MEKPSIFISYSSKDRDTAETIHQQLESSGFDVWRDKTRLETDWSREIAQALADSDVLCLLWSGQAAQSKWVKHEWLTARALEKTLVLCRLAEAPKPPEPLHNLQDVNLEDLEKGSQDLIGRLKDRSDFIVKYDYTVLPENSYIPFNPNPNFTGRGQDLLELYLKLIGNLNKIGINQVGTVGMGGIGKTQLVVEFAYRFSFAFDSVHWIQAGDEGKWLRQFIELARDRLELPIKSDPDKPGADKKFIYALQKYCKENPDMLIIMDNVADPMLLNSDSFLFGLTPLTLGCDLLFTTRKHFRLPGVFSQPVNILSKEGAYQVLTSYRKPHTLDEEKHASSICNAVGYLPLAIILVGAYIDRYRESETPFEDYHEDLLKNKLDTIDFDEISDWELATRHEAAVSTTLKSQWEVLGDEKAKTLFQLAGQLPEAEIIPKARLGLLAGIGPGTYKRDQPLAKAFNLLQDLSLVERLEGNANAIRLHPLVRAFAVGLIQQEEAETIKTTAAKKLKTAVFEYSCLQNELEKREIKHILGDMEVSIDWWGENTEGLRELELLHGALRLSFNQLLRNSDQLGTQLLGRLMFSNAPGIHNLLEQAEKGKKGPWLRPLMPSLTPPGALLRTLEGHSDWISAVAITPDGKMAVSASEDTTLKVWDLGTGEVLQTLEGNDWVTAVAITPDGKIAVSVCMDKTLKVWDLHTGEVLKTLKGPRYHGWGGDAVAIITPDGKTAVSAYFDETLKVWDLESDEVHQRILRSSHMLSRFRFLRIFVKLAVYIGIFGSSYLTLKGHSDRVTAVAITPDGKIAVSASWDKTLKIWDLRSGEVLQTLEEDTAYSYVVAITPDGKTAVSASWDKTLKVWDLHTGEVLQTMKGHSDRVTAVAITPDGKIAVSASEDCTLKVYALHAGEVRQTLEGHSEVVSAVAIAPDGKTAVSASWDKTLKVWDLCSDEVQQPLEWHSKEVISVAITPDGKMAVSASEDRTLKVWDLHTGEVLQTMKGHSDRVTAVAITPDGKIAVSGSEYGTLKVWDLKSGKVHQTLKGDSYSVNVVAITPDSKIAVSASYKTLKVWDLKSGKVLQTLKGHTILQTLKGDIILVTAVALTPDGKTAVAACNTILKVWDLKSGKVLQTLKGHSDVVIAVAITPDGKIAVSVCMDKTLKVWDLDASKVLQTLETSGSLDAVAITPDGKTVVWSSDKKSLKVWALKSGKVPQTLEGHSDRVTAVAITPDGKIAVSASEDNTLKVWDLKFGIKVAGFDGEHSFTACDISPNGKTIVAGENSGRMHFLRLEGMD